MLRFEEDFPASTFEELTQIADLLPNEFVIREALLERTDLVGMLRERNLGITQLRLKLRDDGGGR